MRAASTDGLENVTFGRIADGLGLSKGNLTVLFGDKVSLQLAAFDAAVQRVIEVIVKPALAKRMPRARLRALTDGWFENVRDGMFPGGCFLFGTAHEFRARPGPLRDRAIQQMERWRALFEREFSAAGAADPGEAAFSRAHRSARRLLTAIAQPTEGNGLSALFSRITGIDLQELREVVAQAADDEGVAAWVQQRITPDIASKCNHVLIAFTQEKIPTEFRRTFDAVAPAELRAQHSNLFDLLEADDERTFAQSDAPIASKNTVP